MGLRLLLALGATLLPLAGCSSISLVGGHGGSSSRDCLMRAVYFESNRSSEEGMLAVATVVMNRVADKRYPKTVCGVVGQKGQFASGVLTRPMSEKRSVELAGRVADSVLRGKRHPGVRKAQHFHMAGLRFGYGNMHYVLKAGGNEFYEKR